MSSPYIAFTIVNAIIMLLGKGVNESEMKMQAEANRSEKLEKGVLKADIEILRFMFAQAK